MFVRTALSYVPGLGWLGPVAETVKVAAAHTGAAAPASATSSEPMNPLTRFKATLLAEEKRLETLFVETEKLRDKIKKLDWRLSPIPRFDSETQAAVAEVAKHEHKVFPGSALQQLFKEGYEDLQPHHAELIRLNEQLHSPRVDREICLAACQKSLDLLSRLKRFVNDVYRSIEATESLEHLGEGIAERLAALFLHVDLSGPALFDRFLYTLVPGGDMVEQRFLDKLCTDVEKVRDHVERRRSTLAGEDRHLLSKFSHLAQPQAGKPSEQPELRRVQSSPTLR